MLVGSLNPCRWGRMTNLLVIEGEQGFAFLVRREFCLKGSCVLGLIVLTDTAASLPFPFPKLFIILSFLAFRVEGY